ncbi:type II toxin-antitoxin system VapC family toxin [Cyanobium sp. Cruz CV13-4-11]|nr:type II toxin-antitoxin system VapC family toxin [Cyanobium sp. Cruz CV11-17]MCP9901188.1 type II toxin-antitoxin system VapC family toxin [Cyanobium sp. Cruz CV11-17]MCP9920192.1 type II toxin-antitoxin system VapC family toxin [Cyanobium sp. Cruz CV13-4-11]
MVIDTSAFLAVLLREEGAEALAVLMAEAPMLLMSAATKLEASLVAEGSRIGATSEAVEALCQALDVQVVPFDQSHLLWALRGWREFGKGRHRAGLNLGDCFSYGLARAMNMPLLYKGDDFNRTDVRSPDPGT